MNSNCFALLAIAAFAALPTWSTRAITIRDDRLQAPYLDLAASPEYAPVGRFENDLSYVGSATLIAPDWILTAAHNLVAASSATFTINGTAYTSTELIRHPGYQVSNPMAGYDFGLVHLSQSVEGIPPALLYTGSIESSLLATFVGFGFTGTGLSGWQTVDGQKRACQNLLDGSFGNPAVLLACDFDNPNSSADNGFGDVTPLELEGLAAYGDSGGGVFVGIGSQTYLAGIISFVASLDGSSNSDYGDVNGVGRVSPFVPWITSIVPEPSVPALLIAGGVALVLARSRRN